jgi:hypothetical protein
VSSGQYILHVLSVPEINLCRYGLLLIHRKWIDSCCIDKTSSAELSESINSMFAWYKNAHVCYAYLSDVPGGNRDYETGGLSLYIALEQSRWFTRGWTLQELLAPDWVIVLANDWSELGTKASLATDLTAITGITHLFNFEEASVAQKMSWAARRKTTRLEDRAYSMMGLFNVNMPLLYGEGNRAFIRLQLEILSRIDDESIFAWSNPRPEVYRQGLLAESPECFADCGQIRRGDFDPDRLPHVMTNKGLQMQLWLREGHAPNRNMPESSDAYAAPLNCTLPGEDGPVFVVIYLLEEDGVYSRWGDPDLTTDDWVSEKEFSTMIQKIVHVKQPGHNDSVAEISRPGKVYYSVSFDLSMMLISNFTLAESLVWPENEISWNFWRQKLSADHQQVVTITSAKYCVLLRFQHPLMLNAFTIIVGYCLGRPWIAAITHEATESLKSVASSLDRQNAWPLSSYDSRRFQDRVEINLWYSCFAEATLQKAGVEHVFGPEKYCVRLRIKQLPEETGQVIYDSELYLGGKEGELDVKAILEMPGREHDGASEDRSADKCSMSGIWEDKEVSTPSHIYLKEGDKSRKLEQEENEESSETPPNRTLSTQVSCFEFP